MRLAARGLGLGLRERKLPIGDAKPLLLLRTVPWSSRPGEDRGAGAMTEIESPSSLEVMEVRIEAALSSTEGTDCSMLSVFLERGIRWGSFLPLGATGDRWIGSMSRSNIAEDEEWLSEEL